MTALSASRDTQKLGNAPSEPGDIALPMAASATVYKGGIVLCDTDGNATSTTASTSVAVGRARRGVDNSSGDAGDLIVEVERGVFKFANGGGLTNGNRFETCYVVDDQTVASTDGGGTRARAGIVWDVQSDGVYVLMGSQVMLSLAGVESDIATLEGQIPARIQSYTRVFDHEDTDVDVAATSAEIEIGDALPAGAIVLAVIADVTQDWDDGAAGTFSADVGDGTDDDKFTPTALDIDGGVALLTQSVAVPGGGDQLTVTISGSANLSTLTGGTMSLKVLFTVPDDTVIAAP